MTVMHLAYELGKMEEDILQLSPEEFGRWVAFFQIINKNTPNSGNTKPKSGKSMRRMQRKG